MPQRRSWLTSEIGTFLLLRDQHELGVGDTCQLAAPTCSYGKLEEFDPFGNINSFNSLRTYSMVRLFRPATVSTHFPLDQFDSLCFQVSQLVFSEIPSLKLIHHAFFNSTPCFCYGCLGLFPDPHFFP